MDTGSLNEIYELAITLSNLLFEYKSTIGKLQYKINSGFAVYRNDTRIYFLCLVSYMLPNCAPRRLLFDNKRKSIIHVPINNNKIAFYLNKIIFNRRHESFARFTPNNPTLFKLF